MVLRKIMNGNAVVLLLSLFVVVARGAAVQLWTPVIGTGYCAVTGVSSANPAVVTVADIAHCGIANDDPVWVGEVNNTGGANYSALNIHMDGPTDFDGLCRVVKDVGIGGNRNAFTLRKCDGTTNISNNGRYQFGGKIAKAQQRTMNDGPVAYFDGAAGYVAKCLLDTSATGCANSARGEFAALQTRLTTYPDLSVTHTDVDLYRTLDYALAWWAEGKPESSENRTRMINGITRSLPIPTTACNGTVDCGYSNSGYGDHPFEVIIPNFIMSFNLAWDALSPEQRQTLDNYLWNDFDFRKGGHDFTGSAKAFPAFKNTNPSGSVSYAARSAEVTGTNTAFTTQAVAGDLILLNYNDSYARWFEIASIADDRHLTLTREVDANYGNGNGTGYRLATKWVDDGKQIGWLARGHANNYAVLCGGSLPDAPDCGDYGANAGGTGFDPLHNHQLGKSVYIMLMGLSSAATGSPRGQWVATDALFHFYHNIVPGLYSVGGLAASSSHYHVVRILPEILDGLGAVRFSFTDSPEFMGEEIWNEAAKFALNMYYSPKAAAIFQHNGELGTWPLPFQGAMPGFRVMLFQPRNSYASALKHWIITDQAHYDNSGYVWNRPDVPAVQGTNTSFITLAPYFAQCAAQWTAAVCRNDLRFFAGSRSGTSLAESWTEAGVNLFYNFQSTARRDHEGQVPEVGMQLAINGLLLMGGDGDRGRIDATGRGNTLVFGADGNSKDGGGDGVGVSTPLFGYGTETLMAAGADVTNYYKAGAGLTSAARMVVHAKASGSGYILVRDDFTASKPVTAKQYWHYRVAECGQKPDQAACVKLDRSAKSITMLLPSKARIDSLFTGGDVDTEKQSDTNGTYNGGQGYTFRVTNSVTGTEGSLWAFHTPSGATVEPMPPVEESEAEAHHVVEFKHPKYAAVIVAARAAALNLTGAKFATKWTAEHGQVVVTGLANGRYTLQRADSDVAGCANVMVNKHVFNCRDAGKSGAMKLVRVSPPPPAITNNSPLPEGRAGARYSLALVASGGGTPHSWAVSTGRLCPGLSLSNGGALTGTPTVPQTCRFMATVTAAENLSDSKTFSLTIGAPQKATPAAPLRPVQR